MILTQDALFAIMPNCRFPLEWLRPLNDAMAEFGISDTAYRMATFLGQVAHETNQLRNIEENLYYSPRRIFEVWPSRFESIEKARPFSRNPEKLANRVYADRLGNGSEGSGDGFRYRGRGLFQVTGRENYEIVGKAIDLPNLTDLPDKLLLPRYAAMSAGAFWSMKELNTLADTIETNIENLTPRARDQRVANVVKKITKIINGGTNGLEERTAYTGIALGYLDVAHAA